jgi:hypothetical protein
MCGASPGRVTFSGGAARGCNTIVRCSAGGWKSSPIEARLFEAGLDREIAGQTQFRPAVPRGGIEYRAGQQTDQFRPGHRGPTGHRIEGFAWSELRRCDEVAGHLGGPGHSQAEGAKRRSSQLGGDLPGDPDTVAVQRAGVEPQVVGNEQASSTHRTPPGGGMAVARTGVRLEVAPGAPTDIREAAISTVEEAGELQGLGGPSSEAVASALRHGEVPVLQVPRTGSPGQRDKRNDVKYPDTRVDTSLDPQIHTFHGGPGQATDALIDRRRGPHQGEHRAVVITVAVQVEQRGAGSSAEFSQQIGVPALADVDNALHYGDVAHRFPVAVRTM